MNPHKTAAENIRKARDAISEARSEWANAPRTTYEILMGTQGTSKQVLGAISSMEKTLNKYEAMARGIDATDQAKWNEWNTNVKELIENMHDIAKDGKTTTMTAIVADTVKATTIQVKEKVEKYAPTTLKWMAVAAAIAVVVIIAINVRKAGA